MRDVEKTSMERENNYRRIRRRRRGMPLYGIIVVLLAFAVIVTLSMTVFFNIEKIQVAGDAKMYSAEEIAAATGINAGDNMLRIDIAAAEERALQNLVNVEQITITRQFPSTLLIDVQKCVPKYNIVYEFGTLVVSETGKILEDTMDPQEGLVTIKGYTPFEPVPGTWITAEKERDNKILNAFMELINKGELAVPIVSVDMTEAHNIIVNFDNRIEFDMGNWDEIEYKIDFAQHIISQQPADKEGYLTMIGNNQCSFRDKSNVETPLPQETTEPPTDEFGNPVAETTQDSVEE